MTGITFVGWFFIILILGTRLCMVIDVIKMQFSCKYNKHETIEQSLELIYRDFPDLRNTIQWLIRYSSGRYVIFIDIEDDFDWETADSVDGKLESDEVSSIIKDITALSYASGINYFSYRQKKELFNVLGEGLIEAFKEHCDTASECIENAKKISDDIRAKISRKWQIEYAFFITAVISISFIMIWLWSDVIASQLALNQETIRTTSVSLLSFLGVILSICIRRRPLNYNCSAGKVLNFLEVLSRFFVGIISGYIIIILMKAGLVFNRFLSGNNDDAMLIVMCIIAGFSERLVPSILEKFSMEVLDE